MKKLLILLITIVFVSCSDNGADPKQADSIFAKISVLLKNNEGVNVLGNDKYPTNGIVAKYLINGKIVQDVSNAVISDYPKNVMFVNQGSVHSVTVFLNHAKSEEYPITYIHWNTVDIDTIKAQYKRTENSILLEKAWLFKSNKWEEITTSHITIVK